MDYSRGYYSQLGLDEYSIDGSNAYRVKVSQLKDASATTKSTKAASASPKTASPAAGIATAKSANANFAIAFGYLTPCAPYNACTPSSRKPYIFQDNLLLFQGVVPFFLAIPGREQPFSLLLRMLQN